MNINKTNHFAQLAKKNDFHFEHIFLFSKLESQNDTLIQLLTKDLSKNICLKYRHLIIMEKLFYKVQEPECVAYLFFFFFYLFKMVVRWQNFVF